MTKLAMPRIDRKLLSRKESVIESLKKIIKPENILSHEDQIRPFEKGLLELIKNEKSEILESIQKSGKIEEDTDTILSDIITNYKKNFLKKNNAQS